ncbi:MAG TPA: uracil-DNA glycosylase family protein [Pseudomonadales bacterium]|nr:uracil-DNA glycosylase family protein [Pseudomonadales bacterium]
MTRRKADSALDGPRQGADEGRTTDASDATDPARPLAHDGVIPLRGIALDDLLAQARDCRLCAASLPLGPRPVLAATTRARVLIVGHAPGTRVHASGIPWDDQSGDTLRAWLGVDRDTFYDPRRFAIVPTGLCYPGRGRSGDLPPRPECAPRWHPPLRAALPEVRLTLLLGAHAQAYYLGRDRLRLTDRVERWRTYLPAFLPLPHPSPRNRMWIRRRPWFEAEVLPGLRAAVDACFD